AVAVPVHVSTPTLVRAALQGRTHARFSVDVAGIEEIGKAAPPERPMLHDAALIVFTSGTTGEPKGVVIGHTRLAGKLGVLARLLQPRADDIVLVPLQLTFIFGIWVSLLTIAAGARLVLLPKFSVDAIHGAIKDGATAAAFVPTMLRAWVSEERKLARAPRLVMTGGEPLGAALGRSIAEKFPSADIYDLYGLTETGSCDFFLRASDGEGLGTIGTPTEHVAFRIVAPGEDSTDAMIGGELQIRTPYGMLGYLDDPSLTTGAFADGFFRTGDLARLRPDERVELVGRSKDIISRAGQKIAPLEVDNVFAEHPEVMAALSAGIADAAVGERLHVVVVRRPGSRLSETDLRAWAAARIERFKLPDAIHFCDALPVGRTGKADRAAVAGIAAEAQRSAVASPNFRPLACL
ncbi:MAG TPA: fatty acid--CoA ligase family protein, partial [Xanthobacteraceae bacterium]|nr:fatty acid--CoA ligase family protein [Xanthobacteraceae bacterium]